MAENYHTCFNKVHVKQMTWGIAITHLILVGFVWLMGVLYFLGITKKNEHDAAARTGAWGEHISFAGVFGQGGLMLSATIWLVFILLLMYGLHKNKSGFILAHLIASVIMVVLYIAQIVNNVINGEQIANVVTPIVIAVIVVFLLWIEYRCYNFVRHTPSLLPH